MRRGRLLVDRGRQGLGGQHLLAPPEAGGDGIGAGHAGHHHDDSDDAEHGCGEAHPRHGPAQHDVTLGHGREGGPLDQPPRDAAGDEGEADGDRCRERQGPVQGEHHRRPVPEVDAVGPFAQPPQLVPVEQGGQRPRPQRGRDHGHRRRLGGEESEGVEEPRSLVGHDHQDGEGAEGEGA